MMNNCDLILHFVDKYIIEKEKNIILKQQLLQQQKMQNNSNAMTSKDK